MELTRGMTDRKIWYDEFLQYDSLLKNGQKLDESNRARYKQLTDVIIQDMCKSNCKNIHTNGTYIVLKEKTKQQSWQDRSFQEEVYRTFSLKYHERTVTPEEVSLYINHLSYCASIIGQKRYGLIRSLKVTTDIPITADMISGI